MAVYGCHAENLYRLSLKKCAINKNVVLTKCSGVILQFEIYEDIYMRARFYCYIRKVLWKIRNINAPACVTNLR